MLAILHTAACGNTEEPAEKNNLFMLIAVDR
jgi:hypothetical protein